MEVTKTFTFHLMDQEFRAYVMNDQTIWVSLAEVCDQLECDPGYQQFLVKRCGVYIPGMNYRLVKIPGKFRSGRHTRSLFCLSIDCVPYWLMQIHPYIVKPELRKKHYIFAKEMLQHTSLHWFMLDDLFSPGA